VAAVVGAAALLQAFVLPAAWIRPSTYWLGVAILAAIAGLAARRSGRSATDLFAAGSGEFLCDRCRLNDARYCSRPERPNATRCPDYLGR
jgi:hypothetical protein